MPEENTALKTAAIACGYVTAATYLLAVWAEWGAIQRRHDNWWRGFPDSVKNMSLEYSTNPHWGPVIFALVMAFGVYGRVRSFQDGSRRVRGIDAAVMAVLAVIGLDIVGLSGRNDNYFCIVYDLIGVALLFFSRTADGFKIGPFTFHKANVDTGD